MKVIFVVILIVVSVMLSRGPGVPTQNVSTGIRTNADNNAVTSVTNTNSNGLNPAHGQPGHRCDIKVGQPLNSKPAALPTALIDPLSTAPATNQAKSYTAPFVNPDLKNVTNSLSNLTPQPAGGLNPPHGKPGHRCDIQVGQPLNSKPVTSSATNNSISTTTTATTNATTNTTPVAPGMNPKHGEPGHRCDILVGQPLNSKPTLPAVTNNTPSPITKPATNSTYVAPGLNPRHGQPGHRCDILVGQPLNKPATDSTGR